MSSLYHQLSDILVSTDMAKKQTTIYIFSYHLTVWFSLWNLQLNLLNPAWSDSFHNYKSYILIFFPQMEIIENKSTFWDFNLFIFGVKVVQNIRYCGKKKYCQLEPQWKVLIVCLWVWGGFCLRLRQIGKIFI